MRPKNWPLLRVPRKGEPKASKFLYEGGATIQDPVTRRERISAQDIIKVGLMYPGSPPQQAELQKLQHGDNWQMDGEVTIAGPQGVLLENYHIDPNPIDVAYPSNMQTCPSEGEEGDQRSAHEAGGGSGEASGSGSGVVCGPPEDQTPLVDPMAVDEDVEEQQGNLDT